MRALCFAILIGSVSGKAQRLPIVLDMLPQRSAYESFDAPEPSSGEGLQWKASDRVDWVSGFQGQAPQLADRGAGIHFSLKPGVRAKWLNLREGSLRFRFRPNWNSGEGPGHYASFFSIGAWTPDPPTVGYWALTTNPSGDQVIFSAQQVGRGTTYLRSAFEFQSGRWYDMLLVYSPAATRLYIDGKIFGPGQGVAVAPSDGVCEQFGLRLGNDHHGNQPIRGTIDEFEVYRRALSGFVQRKDAFALTASIDQAVPSVNLRWSSNGKERVTVRRRELGKSQWALLSSVISTNRFVDTSPGLKAGSRYEYAIGQRRISVAVADLPAVEHRGRALLLITREASARIAGALNRFKLDLVGDGWIVEQREIPKHDLKRSARYRRRVAEVKSLIRQWYQKSPAERAAVLLIGNAPIPYSGARAEDGHRRKGDDHRGAWPCDAYYGDLDGVWTDKAISHVNRTLRSNTNRPGDGKFDQDYLPSALEVAVSRIDFSNLPCLSGDALPGNPSGSAAIEAALLQQYFDKNHAYRTGQLRFADRAAVKSYLPDRLQQNIDRNAFSNGCSLFGNRIDSVCELDCFMISRPVLWGFLAGYGGTESFASGRYQTQFMNQPGYGPKAAFFMVYGSWSANWNIENSFTKSALAGTVGGLVVMSSLHGRWNLSALALGEPLSTSYLETANGLGENRAVPRSVSILGDITLRCHVVPPVGTVDGHRNGGSVLLSWNIDEKTKNDLGCFIYRSRNVHGPYRRISGLEPIRVQEYIDHEATTDEPYYMVRRVAMMMTPGGRYTNLSQGRFLKPEG
ncbi:MAG: hypothetical protein M2R45_03874 [Verrucomicrobia subdivision 3 bacterium]|nr:hypothetical protein [Limisphaerales bacterium]MCS1412578.1 hypothetical protein [Limisphaerales bacterium]